MTKPSPPINDKVSALFIKVNANSIVETAPTVTKKYSMTSPNVDAIFIFVFIKKLVVHSGLEPETFSL